jgi:propionyl-CoA carboxylase alpha chain
LKINGHALELRVYAEDPCNNFLPDIGTLHTYKKPEGNGIRIDDGFEEGMSIPIYYDPMIAKMIVHAPTRKDAIDKMIRAIEEYKIVGVKNTLSFGKFVLQHENFVSGNFDTHFVPTYFKPEYLQDSDDEEMKIASWLTTQLMSNTSNKTSESTIASNNESSNWKKNRTSLR